MHYLLSILMIFNVPFAKAGSLRENAHILVEPASVFGISTKNYEDYRIDSNKDGYIDLWVLKKGQTSIILTFKGKDVNTVKITKSRGRIIAENYYVKSGSGFKLTSSTMRQPIVMNGDVESSQTCEQKTSAALKELEQFRTKLSSVEISGAAEDAIQCDNEEYSDSLATALSEILSPDQFSDCIKSPRVVKSFSAESKASLEFISVKMKLDLQKIAHGTDGKKLFRCQASESNKLSANYVEGGEINIKIPKEMSADDLESSIKPLLFHELLHRSGVLDEKTMDSIISACAQNRIPHLKKMEIAGIPEISEMDVSTPTAVQIGLGGVKKSQDKQAATDKTSIKSEAAAAKSVSKPAQQRNIASDASSTGGGGEGVNIAKEVSLAEVKQAIPSADKLAINSVNMTDEGKAQAVAASQRQSAPVFAMADRAMGVMNTPALASSDDSSSYSSSTASSDSSSSTSSRSFSSRASASSGQRYQARHEGYESKTVADTNNNYDAQKGIYVPSSKNGMKVVEEVDLTRQTNAADRTGGNSAVAANSRNVASTGRGTTVPRGSQAAGEEAEFNEVNSASAAGGGGASATSGSSGGSGTFYSGGGSDRKTNANTRRGVASSGSAGTASADSREEVLSRITGTSYKEVKSKLSTSEFKNSLVQNQIKIVDTYGNEVGASQARTIFLDDGSRFIMQRRK